MPTQRGRRWTKRQLDIVFSNSRGCCRICGRRHRRSGHPREWTVDHIYPRAAGGTDDFANLAVTCRRCNGAKSDEYTMFDVIDVFGNSLAEDMNGGEGDRRRWL